MRLEPKLHILPAAQMRLWKQLAPARRLGMVLYGGTAIALRLGHRQSVDFDFFSDLPLDRKLLQSAFPFMAQATILQDRLDTLSLLVPDSAIPDEVVKLSFFGGITFGRIGHPHITDDAMLCIASLDDLMATKLKVLLQRVEAKDYQDIAALLAAHVNLASGLAGARLLFGAAFQPSECLKALTWFKGGDLHLLDEVQKQRLVRAAAAIRDLPQVKLLSGQLSCTE